MSNQKYPQAVNVSSSGTKISHKGREHYSHAKADARKNRRRDEADDRQSKYDALSIKEKIASCIPSGSKKQLARLILLQRQQSPAAPEMTEPKKAKNPKATRPLAHHGSWNLGNSDEQ